jgi:tetratricopeptide (TPR) repeat protein
MRARATSFTGRANSSRHWPSTAARARFEVLTKADPGLVRWQRELSGLYEKLASTLAAAGRPDEAMDAYREHLAIDTKITPRDERASSPNYEARRKSPALKWRRKLAEGYGKLADMAIAAGRHEDALQFLGTRLSLHQHSEPRGERWGQVPEDEVAAWWIALSETHEKIGDVLITLARFDDAVDAYGRGIAIVEKFAEAESKYQAGWLIELAVRNLELGEALAKGNRTDASLKAYQAVRDAVARVTRIEAEGPALQERLAEVYRALGDTELDAGEVGQARHHYLKSAALLRDLADADPENVEMQSKFALSLWRLGHVFDPSFARQALCKALDIMEALARSDKLAADQQDWPKLLEQELAKLN